MLCGDINGKEIQKKRGDIYIYVCIYVYVYTHIRLIHFALQQRHNTVKKLYSNKNFKKQKEHTVQGKLLFMYRKEIT